MFLSTLNLSIKCTGEDNKIILKDEIEKDELDKIDKIIVTLPEMMYKLQKNKGAYCWYLTNNALFIIPYKYCDEEFLLKTPLNNEKMI